MKICFIVGAFPNMKCGIGDYTSKVAEELAKTGNEVHIITSKKANPVSSVLHIHNIMENWSMSETSKIINELKEIKPDVVNIQYPNNEYKDKLMITLLPSRIKNKIKCIVTITIHEYRAFNINTDGNIKLKTKIRLCLNFHNVDKIILVEKNAQDKIKKDYKKANIVYIPISANIPPSKIGKDRKEKLIDKYGMKDKKILSYFGFPVKEKGIEYLLHVVQKLDDVKLLFIGELNSDDEYQKSLIDYIGTSNIKDKVVITGYIENPCDVSDILSISDICVLPFTEGVKENNGSFLAAYNQNISIITTKKENVKDENGIYYILPNDEEKLIDKIKEVLEIKKEFQRGTLTWDNIAKEYLKSFKQE